MRPISTSGYIINGVRLCKRKTLSRPKPGGLGSLLANILRHYSRKWRSISNNNLRDCVVMQSEIRDYANE